MQPGLVSYLWTLQGHNCKTLYGVLYNVDQKTMEGQLWVVGIYAGICLSWPFSLCLSSLSFISPSPPPAAAAAAKSLQSCPTLCDPIDGSPPGSPIPGILQARTLQWLATSFSNAWKWKVKVKSLGRVRLLATPWTAAYQAPPSMGFSRQEDWSGVPLPSPLLPLPMSISLFPMFVSLLPCR